jgi:microcystin-dependent protein
VPVGKNDMGNMVSNVLQNPDLTGLEGNQLGDIGGTESHKLELEEIPPHKHNVRDAGHHHDDLKVVGGSGGNHAGILDRNYQGHGIVRQRWNSVVHNFRGVAAIEEEERGGGQAHTNMQPSIVLNYIIRYRSALKVN